MANKWRMIRTGLTILRKPLNVPTRPLHFQLEPATGCNLRCKMCQVPHYPPEMFKNMSLDQFQHIFDQIRPIKVALSGAGEPFLNPELLEIIRYASHHGASVLTTTNFTLCTKKLEAIVDSGLSLIKVSIDAATPETYANIRGRDFHGRIVRDIKELQRIKKEKNSIKPYLRMQFVLQTDSIPEIAEVIELAHELGANSLYFQPLETLLVAERKEELIRDITFDDLKQRLAAARDRAQELGIGTNAGILIKNMEGYFRKYEKGVPEEPPQRICLLPWFSLYITVDGKVRPCCSFGEGETLFVGNLFEQSFEEIWNSEMYRKFRRDSLDRKLTYAVCRNCTPNRLRDFVRLAGVLPGFFGSACAADETTEG
jgi:radical SAM protein with 4Fe4S-binding SPASM domain